MKSQASSPYEAMNSAHLSMCQKDVRPSVQKRWRTMAFKESPQGIRSSLHLVRWNMSLHLRHCRETQPSFESGHHGVHSTWGRKHRVTLTYLFLREGASSGACGKLAYLFSQIHWIILILRWYRVHGTFLKLLYWNWWPSILEKVVSGNLSRLLKVVKSLVLYDVDPGVVLEPIQGKLASSQFDFEENMDASES